MAEFPIVRATGTLPGIAPAARGDIDVRTGARLLAQAISGLGKDIEKFELMQASTELSEFKRKVREEHSRLAISYDGNLDPNTFKAEYENSLATRQALIPKNRFAARAAREWLNDRIPFWAEGVEKARQARVSDNFKAGGFELKTEAERTGDTSKYFQHLHTGGILDVYDKEEIAKLKQDTTDKSERSLINNLIRQGQTNLAFEAVRESQLDAGEKRTFENAIRVAQNAIDNNIENQKKQLVDKTTSEAIREYFNGELSVTDLNIRHEAGLIRDSEFKFMMTGLTKKVPDDTDPFAAGNIRRAMVDFEMGAIKRSEADEIVLENYTNLDGADRSNVVADLEDIEEKIIAVAKSNAYSEGRGLMSQRFVGIQSEEDLIDLFRGAGLSEEEKSRINRRWRAEVNNRDLYERAINDRFREMRKEKISDVEKFRAESLRILLQYQRRTQLKFQPGALIPSPITLEELEESIAKEQKEIISKPKPIKPISKMSTAEKRKELERIRELKKLK